MSADHDPLTDAELDQLDALNRARTPGRLCVARSSRGEYGIFGGPDGEEWIATLAHAREADARAIAAALNALPSLLAEVRASRRHVDWPGTYTLEPASPEMRERYGVARGKVAK